MKKILACLLALGLLTFLFLPVGSPEESVPVSGQTSTPTPDSVLLLKAMQETTAKTRVQGGPEDPAEPVAPAEPVDPVEPDKPDEPVHPPAQPSQFSDVPPGKFYTEAVEWAVQNGVTDGTTPTTFSPNAPCTRAQAVTFLWRAAGMPAPKSTIHPFADVRPGKFYSEAVAWAVENGITTGTAHNRFSPSATCSRAQIVTFLHRAAGTPEAGGGAFDDVPAGSYYELAVNWAVQSGVTNGISPTSFGPGSPCTRGHIVTFLQRARDIPIDPKPAPFSQHFSLYYADMPLGSSLECDVNRPYLSVQLLHDRFGVDLADLAQSLSWPVRYGPEGEYIALADAVKLCRLGVRFDDTDESVHLYTLADYNWAPTTPEPGAAKAYLRLEDIMADFGINGRFTHDNLIKLRLFGDYLRDHTDAFYIAWIPLYVNPGKDIRNDISRDESFYNTDFVFTLDCLVEDGGKMGLHGLSHQHADEISADGFEFGDDFSYTKEQILDIFKQAETICNSLGYTHTFFEFPHYTASEMQKQVAEEHFSIVYQQCSDAASSGHIEIRTVGKHTCLWVPTPAGCVQNSYDIDGIIERLNKSYNSGKEISLYFHPVVDNRCMNIEIRDDVMRYTYNEQKGIMGSILRLTESWGYRFSAIK